MGSMIDFQRHPEGYRHWRLAVDGELARLELKVDEEGGLRRDYALKLNSYDLAVDIELHDAVQRLRFEHPEVRAVVVASGDPRVFSAGANIRMLAGASHDHKVNFCKFTNETRLAMEEASAESGQAYVCAVAGSCAGGGYELALACDWIVLADDGSSSVALPELPLLAVLPGTGGLTRLVDKRRVRRDRADVFCTLEEGVRGRRAVEWRLVDEAVPRSRLEATALARARELAVRSDRPRGVPGVPLTPLARRIEEDALRYETVEVAIDRARRAAHVTIRGPDAEVSADAETAGAAGAGFWPLRLARELEDAILHLRLNEVEIGTWVLHTAGDAGRVAAYDALLAADAGDWFLREVRLHLKRVLKRLELSARSLFALIEPGSCYTGTLLELALAADRSYMLSGRLEGDDRPPATLRVTDANLGPYPMSNGLARLESRFLDDAEALERVRRARGEDLEAEAAEALGLVTFAPDDIDWEDEIRIALEERASFSPDALTGLEASLRFAGPETLETKIFGRLSTWQNWIFARPNASGEKGALPLYGTGQRSEFDRRRA